MLLKIVFVIAIAMHSSFEISMPESSIKMSDGEILEKIWTVIYYYELDELDDEIAAFRTNLDSLKLLCQSEMATKFCAPYVDLVMKGVNSMKTDRDYIERFDVGTDKTSKGRRNSFKIRSIDQQSFINFEMNTTFQNTTILTGKIDKLMQCQPHCHVKIDEFGDIVNEISKNLIERVYSFKTILFNAKYNLYDEMPIPIAREQFMNDMTEVERIIEEESLYEADVAKMESGTMQLASVSIVNNRFLAAITIPLRLKDDIRNRLQAHQYA